MLMLMIIMSIDYYIQKNEKNLETFYNKRLDKIEESTKNIYGNNLVFTTISTGRTIDFSRKDGPFTLLNKIKKGEIIIEEAKESQKHFDKYLKIVRKGNKNHEQQKTLANLNMLFNGRNNSINFIEGYRSKNKQFA